MRNKHSARLMVLIVALVAVATLAISSHSARAQAHDNGDDQESRIQRGFEIAPVPLNLEGKDRALVGLGSYLVNAVGSCNDCHDAGPQTQFALGGNPFFGQAAKINPATYLGVARTSVPSFQHRDLHTSSPATLRLIKPVCRQGDDHFPSFSRF